MGQIVPGLERELAGMSVDEEKDVVVQPEDGYGIYDPSAMEEVPLDFFGTRRVEQGNAYVARTQDGQEITFLVKQIKDDSALLDFNHPLAGKVLHFHIKITGIRDLRPEDEAEMLGN